MKKATIIYNPKSGRRTIRSRILKIVETISNADYRVEIFSTKYAGHAVEISRQTCQEGCDLIIVAGGDGTISEVVNGLWTFENRPILGYIPSGTANDFASSLGIPFDINKCLDIIINGIHAKIDIGSFNNDKVFNYIVATGAFTRLTYTTPYKLKQLFGFFAYLKDIFKEIPLIKAPFPLKLTVNDVAIEGQFVIALIINSPNFAGLKKVLPDSCMDDGIFDILLVPKSRRRKLMKTLHAITLGLGLNESSLHGIKHIKGTSIAIETLKEIDWNIDGELGGKGEVHIDCKHKFLDIMVPSSAIGMVLHNQGV